MCGGKRPEMFSSVCTQLISNRIVQANEQGANIFGQSPRIVLIIPVQQNPGNVIPMFIALLGKPAQQFCLSHATDAVNEEHARLLFRGLRLTKQPAFNSGSKFSESRSERLLFRISPHKNVMRVYFGCHVRPPTWPN